MSEIVGYLDPWRAVPGERIRVHVSTDQPQYEARLVQLLSGDESPVGPGVRRTPIPGPWQGPRPGRAQDVVRGSFATASTPLPAGTDYTVSIWAWPTHPGRGSEQVIAGTLTGSGDAGWSIGVGPDGRLTLWTSGAGAGLAARSGACAGLGVRSGGPRLHPRRWVHLLAAVDASAAEVTLAWQIPDEPADRGAVGAPYAPVNEASPALAAWALGREGAARWHFDGKLAAPLIAAGAWGERQREALLRRGAEGHVGPEQLLAAWDFATDPASDIVTDRCGGGPLRLHRLPTRAVTGPAWRGHGDLIAEAEHFDAIHFHSDDLDDARWDPDFELALPADVPSGVYAVELDAGAAIDTVPLFVHPPRGTASSDTAILFPTLSYLAYANERMQDDPRSALSRPVHADAGSRLLRAHPEYGSSVYDTHSDGSGVCLSSGRRPILNLRPGHRNWQTHAPRALSADLYVVDWLDRDGVGVDALTDHLLIDEGIDLLRRYRVIITGSHPEYWTEGMLDALRDWLAEGGRLMYLGGNGFYWVTAVHPGHPHVVEVRRGMAGIRSWESAPGETRLQSTGEQGGLWRHRGRDPNRLAGVGFAGFGFDPVAPGYACCPGSRDPRAAWILDGVSAEVIGDHGLILGGAAGDEVDRYDRRWGSPPHALVLGSSAGRHTDSVQLVVEDVLMTSPDSGADVNPGARADLVFFETAAGGAVFSAGSMAWNGTLADRGFDNDVATICRNVLRRFRDPQPFPEPPVTPPVPYLTDASSVSAL